DVRMPREGEDARLTRLAHDADRLERTVAAGSVPPAGMEAPVAPAHRRCVLDEVALDEEVRDAGRLDERLETGTIARVVVQDAGHPVRPVRAVGALGEPHPLRP